MSKTLGLLEEGVLVCIITATEWPGSIDLTDFDPLPEVGDVWDPSTDTFNKPTPPEEPTPNEARLITTLALDNRFTFSERVAIEMARDQSKATSQEERIRAASVEVLMNKINRATFVDLDRQDTIQGVSQLELLGLIDVGRANEILSAPIQEIEKWKGISIPK